LEGIIGNYIEESFEIFERNGTVMSTTEPISGLEDPDRLGINKESNQKISLN
tara:strand:- start:630 stop:785 length:156 start_codon:yes stop_codon:yes gene_type:complete